MAADRPAGPLSQAIHRQLQHFMFPRGEWMILRRCSGALPCFPEVTGLSRCLASEFIQVVLTYGD